MSANDANANYKLVLRPHDPVLWPSLMRVPIDPPPQPASSSSSIPSTPSSSSSTAPPPLPTPPVDERDLPLCDIDDPLLFQTFFARIGAGFHRLPYWKFLDKIAKLSPKALLIALAANTSEKKTQLHTMKKLTWILHGHPSYVDRRPHLSHIVNDIRILVLDEKSEAMGIELDDVAYRLTGLREIHRPSLRDSFRPVSMEALCSWIKYLPNLSTLYLQTFVMSDTFARVTQMNMLEHLHLEGPKETSFTLFSLSRLTRLKSLALHLLPSPTLLPQALSGLQCLTRLETRMAIDDGVVNVLPSSMCILKVRNDSIARIRPLMLAKHPECLVSVAPMVDQTAPGTGLLAAMALLGL